MSVGSRGRGGTDGVAGPINDPFHLQKTSRGPQRCTYKIIIKENNQKEETARPYRTIQN